MRSWYDSTLKDEGFQVETLNSPESDKGTMIENPYDPAIYSLDSGVVDININGSIRVTYTGQVPDKKYLGHPKSLSTQCKSGSWHSKYQAGFSIQENGYFFEQPEITNMGHWAWKKNCGIVPYDYNPE